MTAVIQDPASRVITVTGQEGGRPAVIEDPGAAHQIVHLYRTVSGVQVIAVTCNCLLGDDWIRGGQRFRRQRFRHGQWIEIRKRWEPGEAATAYRNWHAGQGIEVTP